MISNININGTEYKIAPVEEEITTIGDLPDGIRIFISNTIQHGLAKNKSIDDIMNEIVIRSHDGQNYLKTNHEGILMAIRPEVAKVIKSIMTGDDV